MLKKFNIKIFLFLISIIIISIIIISGYLLISSKIEDKYVSNLEKIFNVEQRQFIKTYFFPYKVISLQKKVISEQKQKLDSFSQISAEIELIIKEKGVDIKVIEGNNIELSDKKNLKKYKLNSGFHLGIANANPGSAYIDFHQNNLFILSSRGVLAFKKNLTNNKIDLKYGYEYSAN